MAALVYLTACTWKNQLRWRLRRLREPKYTISLLAAVVWFGFIFRPGRHSPGGGVLQLAGRAHESVVLGLSVLLFVIVALAWAWPSKGKASLAFTRSEVQFLFPAPFARQELIAYKVLRLQFGGLASSAFMTLFFRPGSVAAGWMFFLGTSLVVALLTTHLTGVSLAKASIVEHGRTGLARQKFPLLVVIGAVGVLVFAVVSAWPRLSGLQSGSEIAAALQQIFGTGLPAIVLWPFRAVVRLPLAPSAADFFAALPPVLALLALNFVWAVRSDAAFEEASAELAEKVSRVRSGAESILPVKRRRPPFTLQPSGSVEVALLWKNLIMLSRYAGIRTAFVLLPMTIGIGFFVAGGSESEGLAATVAFLCIFLAAMTVMLGASLTRNDLRQDMERLAILKSWPVRGAALIRGEILAPTLVLTAVAWAFLLCGGASSARVLKEIGGASYVAAAIIIAPGVILAQVFLQNALVIVLPAWAPVRRSHAAGLDVIGQGMVTFFGLLLALLGAMVPAAALALITGVVLYLLTSVVSVVVPAVVFLAMLIAECAAASEALGAVLDRTDISAVDPTE